MILIEDKDLELVKLIKTKNDEESIYQFKDKNLNNKFFIIVETIPKTNNENIYKCMEMDTLEDAIKQANSILNIRQILRKNNLKKTNKI